MAVIVATAMVTLLHMAHIMNFLGIHSRVEGKGVPVLNQMFFHM
jgi:hypothetical protein